MSTAASSRLLSAILLALFVATSILLPAQTATSGLVSGTITEPPGAMVPGTTIVLTQHGTTPKSKATSDAVGHYVFPAVDPADYTVAFSANGFQTTVVQQLHVEVQRSYTLSMALKLGRASETIEVADVPPADYQPRNSTSGRGLAGLAVRTSKECLRDASVLWLYS